MARKNPRRNIARINMTGVTGTNYGGWEVRFSRKGKKIAKFYSDTKYGGKRAALAAAKECRDDLEAKYKKYTVEELAQHPSKRNTSGTVGVRLINRIETHGAYEYHYWYWVAQWTDGRGKRRTKTFSVHKYGDSEAYRLACKARTDGIRAANR